MRETSITKAFEFVEKLDSLLGYLPGLEHFKPDVDVQDGETVMGSLGEEVEDEMLKICFSRVVQLTRRMMKSSIIFGTTHGLDEPKKCLEEFHRVGKDLFEEYIQLHAYQHILSAGILKKFPRASDPCGFVCFRKDWTVVVCRSTEADEAFAHDFHSMMAHVLKTTAYALGLSKAGSLSNPS